MSSKEQEITDLVSHDFIEKHSIHSSRVYGTAIHERGAVNIIASDDIRVEAWVDGLDGKVIE
ncbi:MAG: hypothetical protein EXS67_01535 [Candidatus Margulisbacteria bacterium]|nr:hypothetical protein [Candidatus Margulisiibacteriota bacterium]